MKTYIFSIILFFNVVSSLSCMQVISPPKPPEDNIYEEMKRHIAFMEDIIARRDNRTSSAECIDLMKFMAANNSKVLLENLITLKQAKKWGSLTPYEKSWLAVTWKEINQLMRNLFLTE